MVKKKLGKKSRERIGIEKFGIELELKNLRWNWS